MWIEKIQMFSLIPTAILCFLLMFNMFFIISLWLLSFAKIQVYDAGYLSVNHSHIQPQNLCANIPQLW